MKQYKSYCIAIQQSLDLIGFLIYPWLNSITIVLSMKFSKHPPFEVTYGFQPATHVDRLLSLTGAPAPIGDRLSKLANVREGVREFLTLSKQRRTAR